MASSIKQINPEDFSATFGSKEAFALDVLVGLSDTRKSLPSKYMYDDEGSRLFERITLLPEYYPTDREIENLEQYGTEIAITVEGAPFNMIELGPGNGRKAAILIDYFLHKGLEFQYVPIDISRGALEDLIENLEPKFPDLKINALISDYFTGIKWLNHRNPQRNLMLFLGSNIGNFTHADSRFFLRNLWNALNRGDRVLIGFDLKKDIELLLSAYNDPGGVTADFNLNLLKRINRELGGNFDCSKFRHFGTYNVFTGAMESYIISLEHQEVFVEEIGRSFSFRPWEPIHTEYSYKYLESDINTIAGETGFRVLEHLYDSKRYYVDSVWEVLKEPRNGDK